MVVDVLTFEVDRHRYALPVADVHEVVRAVAVVPLPKAPPVVQGIINLRGQVVPVLDLRTRFGLPARPLHLDDHLVVVRAGTRLVVLRADRALGLTRVDDHQIEPMTSVVPRAEYVAGLAKLPDGIVLISDPRAFLSEAESARLSEALSAGAPSAGAGRA